MSLTQNCLQVTTLEQQLSVSQLLVSFLRRSGPERGVSCVHCHVGQALVQNRDDERGIEAFWAFFISEIRRLNAFVADNESVCTRKLDVLNLDGVGAQSESAIINTLTFCKALKELLPALGTQLIGAEESKVVDVMSFNPARLDAFKEFLLAATNLDHLRKVFSRVLCVFLFFVLFYACWFCM